MARLRTPRNGVFWYTSLYTNSYAIGFSGDLMPARTATRTSHVPAALRRGFFALATTAAAIGAQQPARPLSQPPAPRVVRADEIPSAAPNATNPARGIRDRAELEAFLDGLMTANLGDKHVS